MILSRSPQQALNRSSQKEGNIQKVRENPKLNKKHKMYQSLKRENIAKSKQIHQLQLQIEKKQGSLILNNCPIVINCIDKYKNHHQEGILSNLKYSILYIWKNKICSFLIFCIIILYFKNPSKMAMIYVRKMIETLLQFLFNQYVNF